MDKQKATKQIKPDSNKIQISGKRDTGFYVFLSKLFLMDFENIELHALGDAIAIGVKVGELLCRYRYTDIARIETTTIVPTAEEKQNDQGIRRGKKAKLIIKLNKSKDFPNLIKNFRIQQEWVRPILSPPHKLGIRNMFFSEVFIGKESFQAREIPMVKESMSDHLTTTNSKEISYIESASSRWAHRKPYEKKKKDNTTHPTNLFPSRNQLYFLPSLSFLFFL